MISESLSLTSIEKHLQSGFMSNLTMIFRSCILMFYVYKAVLKSESKVLIDLEDIACSSLQQHL